MAAIRNGGLVLAGLTLSAMTEPGRWVHVGGVPGSYTEHLDRESVTQDGARVTLWTRRDYLPDQSTVWHEIEFDCSRRTATIFAYVRDDGKTVSHNVVRPYQGPAPIVPDSSAEQIFNIACRTAIGYPPLKQ